MHCDLPPYVMKCLLLAGYDEKDVIQAMDTTENEGNSISMIERYINERYREDPELNFGLSSGNLSLPFQFPPGQRLRICNFVKRSVIPLLRGHVIQVIMVEL